MSIEAMKQALRQLNRDDEYLGHRSKTRADAITALRQAIEQAEQPPVKTYCGGKPNYCTPEETPEVDETAKVKYMDMSRFPAEIPDWKPGMVVPKPKREWVGLTDDEIDDWFFQRLKQAGDGWALDDVVRAVEAKLKEKNVPQP